MKKTRDIKSQLKTNSAESKQIELLFELLLDIRELLRKQNEMIRRRTYSPK